MKRAAAVSFVLFQAYVLWRALGHALELPLAELATMAPTCIGALYVALRIMREGELQCMRGPRT